MGLLTGKRALVVGVASNRSIAWGVAQAMHREGADLAFSYQGERLEARVRGLAAEVGSDLCLPCDVAEDAAIDALVAGIGARWDGLDILVHAVAYAPREALDGEYLDGLTREAWRLTHDVSAYSFAALARATRPLLQGRAGALLTLSYLGADRVIPHYNVMGPAKASLEANVRYLAACLGPEGLRVNAISAGPIKTLAAAGISDFRRMLERGQAIAPLRRNVTIEEVGNVAAFLCSDLASAVTGEVMFVDAGINIIGMSSG